MAQSITYNFTIDNSSSSTLLSQKDYKVMLPAYVGLRFECLGHNILNV